MSISSKKTNEPQGLCTLYTLHCPSHLEIRIYRDALRFVTIPCFHAPGPHQPIFHAFLVNISIAPSFNANNIPPRTNVPHLYFSHALHPYNVYYPRTPPNSRYKSSQLPIFVYADILDFMFGLRMIAL
jgi:hypothetical protein